MRELKFRGWYTNALGNIMLSPEFHGPINEIFNDNKSRVVYMQYTGLKDKNGREIYEGDIVEFCDFDSLRTGGNTSDNIVRGYVSMLHGTWSVEVNGGDIVYELWNAHENDSELEVLGNRFENPELLEV